VQLLTDNLQLLEDCLTVHGRNDKPITFAAKKLMGTRGKFNFSIKMKMCVIFFKDNNSIYA
jgi:hypothetical protein